MTIIPTNEYLWNPNFADPIAHTDIKKVIEELEVIQETFGKITPLSVVESARNKKSTLHSYFEWDDQKAAQKWRLGKASELLSRISVNVIKDGEPRMVRAFEISKRDFKGEVEYKIFDSSNLPPLNFLKGQVMSDLVRIKNRLDGYGLDSVSVHVEKAIEELTKVSTETEVQQPTELKAVS